MCLGNGPAVRVEVTQRLSRCWQMREAHDVTTTTTATHDVVQRRNNSKSFYSDVVRASSSSSRLLLVCCIRNLGALSKNLSEELHLPLNRIKYDPTNMNVTPRTATQPNANLFFRSHVIGRKLLTRPLRKNSFRQMFFSRKS